MVKFIRKMIMFKKLKSAIKKFNYYLHSTDTDIVEGLTQVNSDINRLKLDLVELGVSHEKIDRFEKGVK